MTMLLSVRGGQAGCPREPEGTSEAESRARGNNAGPPGGLPTPDSYAGSAAPSITGVGGQPPPIFTPAGRHPQGHRRLLCLVGPLRVFRTAELELFHAARCQFRY